MLGMAPRYEQYGAQYGTSFSQEVSARNGISRRFQRGSSVRPGPDRNAHIRRDSTCTRRDSTRTAVGDTHRRLSVATAPAVVAATPAPSPTPIPYVEPSASHPLGKGSSVSITPNERFYNVAITQRNDWLQASTFSLTVGGAVSSPLKFSLSDLKALPAVEQMRTLECIGNPVGGDLISNAMWKGVHLQDVLTQAGLSSAAVEIKLMSADSLLYHDSGCAGDESKRAARLRNERRCRFLITTALPCAASFPAATA